MLGAMHRDGEGGPEDFAEARRLLGLAAARGLLPDLCLHLEQRRLLVRVKGER